MALDFLCDSFGYFGNSLSKLNKQIEKHEAVEQIKIELNLVTDALETNEREMQQIIGERNNYGKQLMEAMEELSEERTAHEQTKQEFEQCRDELEQFKTDLIESNNKIVELEQVGQENSDLSNKLQTMELNYVEAKDAVKQGNNLFAEVEERKEYSAL